MDGRTYYTFKAPTEDVRFFALETDYLNAPQVAWLEKELASANERWKIPYFHHPLYSSGKRHGSHTDLAAVLEPLFLKAGVSVVFAGHDHFYERTKPQKGIVLLRHRVRRPAAKRGIDRRTGLTALGFDTDQAFLVAEIDGDQLYFNAISRLGNGHRLGRSSSGGSQSSSSASALPRSWPTGGALAAQSASNTALIFLAAAVLLTMTPTSRRPSSSSLRRLWLPTKTLEPSRIIARTCSRRSGELPRLDARQPLLDLADDANLDAGLGRSASVRQDHPISTPATL